MSSPFTATFLTHWRNNATRVPILLALVTIAAPSPVTLRVATREVTTPDGNTWENGLLYGGSLRARVEQLGAGLVPCDATIHLANRLYPFMSSGLVADTLATHQWQGATVTLYLWNDVRDDSGAQLLAWADAGCILEAARIDSYRVSDEGVELTLLQDQSWNNRVPATIVDKIAYPNAPDVSQGRPVPLVYGDHRALPLRSPWTAAYTNKQYQEDAGAGTGAVPGLLVDPGLGADHVKVVYASHACMELLSRSTGYSQFLASNDVLSPLDTAGITESLGASESYITIDDDTLIAYYGVRPLEPRATYNTADNARRAADPFDETSYATIDQSASKNVLELSLPSVASLGYIEAVDVFVAFSGDPANANTFRVRPQIPGSTSYAAITSTLGQAQSATPVILSGTWDATTGYGQAWQFGGATTGSPVDLKCEFTGGTTNVGRVYWAVLRVKYRPQRSLVTPAFISGGFFAGAPIPPTLQYWPWKPGANNFPVNSGSTFQGAVLQLHGQFYANIKGYADDGSGTYTGSAGALIERPCDIAHHFLVTHGGVAGADIETGAADFGSFVLARSTLRDSGPNDFKLAPWIGSKTSVQQVLREIAAQSLSCIYLDRFTGQWLFHPWRRGPAVDYDLAFERTDCPDLFEAGVLSDVGLAQGVRVRWGYDHFKNRTLFETFVNADGSSQGYGVPTQRDQKLTIEAGVNDDLDWTWSTGPATYADVLTPGTYAPIDLAAEVRTQMRTHQSQLTVGFGYHIKAGFNDDLDYTIGATPYVATLAPGTYTPAELCFEVASKMSAGAHGQTFTATFGASTNRFTVAVGSGTFAADVVGAPNYSTSAWFVLGFTNSVAAAASMTGAASRYKDRFWFAYNSSGGAANFDLLFGTGASASTNCAHVLGFDRTDAIAGSAQYGDYTRGQREALCADSEDVYGPRADGEIVASWVRDETSAQLLRDGVFDFGSVPLVWVKWRSHACPDMQRLRIVEFSSDMDARRRYPGYGSDGSWAGKRFRVLEVSQDLGPSFHTEVMALEA